MQKVKCGGGYYDSELRETPQTLPMSKVMMELWNEVMGEEFPGWRQPWVAAQPLPGGTSLRYQLNASPTNASNSRP